MESRILTLITVSLLSLSAIVATSFALAQDNPIQLRQEKMKVVGKSIGTVSKMVKGETPFDGQLALAAFSDMQSAARGYDELFPKGTETGGNTEAAPAIWSDRSGFEAKHNEFLVVLDTVTETAPADTVALRTSLGQVGRQCSSCHETYRLKK